MSGSPGIGLNFSFHFDSWSRLFVIMILGIGAVLFVYAWGYLETKRAKIKFYALMTLFAAAMTLLVSADDALILFLGWEITSLISYFLIAFEPRDPNIRKGALTALLITSFGGLFLLAGFTVLHLITGSWSIQTWMSQTDLIVNDPRLTLAVVCILIGVFSKSAQFPFHFWLPAAMTAPAPVSAYLHSATMVKAGVYLSYRLWPLFGAVPIWSQSLLICGGITFVWGTFLSLLHDKMKSVLAGTTVSMLGLMFFTQGLASGNSVFTERLAPILFGLVISHGFYKAGYFIFAGTLTHVSHEKHLSPVVGLGTKSKILLLIATGLFLAATALPGTPLWFAKTALKNSAIGAVPDLFFEIIFLLLTLMPIRFLFGVFGPNLSKQPLPSFHPPRSLLTFPIFAFVIVGLFGALVWPLKSIPELVELKDLVPAQDSFILKWAPVLSITAVYMGFLWLSGRSRELNVAKLGREGLYRLQNMQGAYYFQSGWERFLILAGRLTKLTQPGSLRPYLLTLTISLAVIWGATTFEVGQSLNSPFYILLGNQVFQVPGATSLIWYCALISIAMTCLVGLGLCVWATSALQAIIGLSLVGYATAVFFAISGAADLAMTQVAVESLSLLLFLACLKVLPAFTRKSNRPRLAFDALIAASLGFILFVTLLMSVQNHAGSRLAPFFSERALSEGFGRNVVNVILVDFRALDTLGEITVLAIAGLSIFGLLSIYRKGEAKP